jgi:FdhD protein
MPSSHTLRSTDDPLRQVSAPIVRWAGAEAAADRDELAAEEPLEIRAWGRDAAGALARETVATIMRTPGHDEELAAGFLFTEGLLSAADLPIQLRPGTDADELPSPNVLDIETAPPTNLLSRLREGGYTRRFTVNASCGVCGKNTVAAACESFPRLPTDDFSVAPEVLYALPERLRAQQRVFRSTGGLHAAGLFESRGTLLAMREDVGRHNAVDKLIGRALLDGALPLCERILLVSGRLSFEIVQKALAAGISLVAAVSAPSSLAVDLAEAGGMTLAAFLRGERVNVYTHPQRVHAPE